MSDDATILRIAVEHDGVRLDRFLAEAAVAASPEPLSRARIQALIKDGAVLHRASGAAVATAASDGSLKVKAGDHYEIHLGPPQAATPVGENIPLTIVHEDRDVIVIDKPAGLVVHPAAGHATGTLVNALIAHCGDTLSGIGGVRRPGIVHRLDKDTSGLLVVAKNDKAHQGLTEQFQAHGLDGRLVRRYRALVWGAPERPTGRIDAALGRAASNRTKITVTRGESGRHAVTHFERNEVYLIDPKGIARASLLTMSLETGRTHQIRVHLAHIGHPVMGDATYGSSHKASAGKLPIEAADALAALNRQALHAAILGFEHPRTGKSLLFESKLPADMARLRLGLRRSKA